jgi:hypothetical protein
MTTAARHIGPALALAAGGLRTAHAAASTSPLDAARWCCCM